MGIPMVGKRHQRQTSTSEIADWQFWEIPQRICSAGGSGRSSANHQQPIQAQEFIQDDDQHSLGALLSRGTASQGNLYTRCIYSVHKELDPPSMGQLPLGTSENRRGGTLAAGCRDGGRNQGQDQVRDVGPVLSCRSLGVLRATTQFLQEYPLELAAREVRALG